MLLPFAGGQVRNPLLRQSLMIPQSQMASVAASSSRRPDEPRAKVVSASSLVEEAEHLLAKAAQAYDGAASAAGLAPGLYEQWWHTCIARVVTSKSPDAVSCCA